MHKNFILSTLILFTSFFYAQVGVGTVTPAEGAILDIYSNDSGIYIPRVNLVATNSQAPIVSVTPPEPGLLVYNKATAGTYPNEVTPGFYWWYGAGWIKIGNSVFSTSGDITSNRPGSSTSGSAFVFGSTSLEDVPGFETRLSFETLTGGFRAGTSGLAGFNSAVFGELTTANFYSVAVGRETLASNYSMASGFQSQANGFYSTAMGYGSIADGMYSTALGASQALGDTATAMGGSSASGNGATAMGGSSASGTGATAMGISTASGNYATAMGFSGASGAYATAMGSESYADGQYSTAIGNYANAIHNGSFVYADFDGGGLFSSAPNQFSVKATGGYRLFSNWNETSGVTLAPGAGAWANVSDKNKKENFVQLDTKNILSKIKVMPISEWNYLSQDKSVRHVGPMAQDFYAAFGLGGFGNDTTIVSTDIDGINMAAIQALAIENEALQLDNETLKSKLKELEGKFSEFTSELNEIKTLLQGSIHE